MNVSDQIENGYRALKETAEKHLNRSGYSVVNLTELFSGFVVRGSEQPKSIINDFPDMTEEDEEEEL